MKGGEDASGALGLHKVRTMGRPYDGPNETIMCRMSKRGRGGTGPVAGGEGDIWSH